MIFGTPARFGNPAAQLKSFIDTAGPLWQQGTLADKVFSAFTSASTAHGGQESTLLALGNVFYHWGGIIVPPGYTDPIQYQSGNPYGTSHTSGRSTGRGRPRSGQVPGEARRGGCRCPQGRPRGAGRGA